MKRWIFVLSTRVSRHDPLRNGSHNRTMICLRRLFATISTTDLFMTTIASSVWRQRLSVALRVLGAVLGGYAFSAALVALLALILPLVGMPRSEAVVLASMLGFLIYLALLIWAFAERKLWRVWAGLGAGTAMALLLVWIFKR